MKLLKDKLCLMLILVFIMLSNVLSQNAKENEKTSYVAKNCLNASFGAVVLTYTNAGLNYERIIGYGKRPTISAVFMRIGLGIWQDWGNAATNTLATINYLTGHKNNHFEYGYGLVYSKGFDPFIVPAGNVGYRYQNPKGGLVFRTGIAFPETIFVTGGYSF